MTHYSDLNDLYLEYVARHGHDQPVLRDYPTFKRFCWQHGLSATSFSDPYAEQALWEAIFDTAWHVFGPIPDWMYPSLNTSFTTDDDLDAARLRAACLAKEN